MSSPEEIHYSVSARLDAEELGQLLAAAAGSAYTEAMLTRLIEGSTAYVTARAGDRLVGFGRLLSDGAVTAYINNMAVSPDHQDRGIGGRLLDLLVETAGEVKSIYLYTDTADAFYLRHDFRPSEKRLYVRRRDDTSSIDAPQS
ncbi:GNAT family N-acetyltransferase [Propionivibrio dicarboxylicus]|uniref:Acetyltransferase (GNAT) domain-containing protein n=1 Tax=Propionivibrio dicarboxylicus TaxID=83767 RepID=A0A1G8JAX4_9RHOO|nr:GNAT family N-acetyltransferase [Propionivibrio dicarboxylicus]SDI28241.1 Acetyltransferase (GNAT) domain-containing protein [Propionivibrio dicarboxylicus]